MTDTAARPGAPCPKCGHQPDTPNHVYGCDRQPATAATRRTASGAEFNVWVDSDAEHGFRAYSGFVPGLVAYGSSVAEALSNFADGYANREDAR